MVKSARAILFVIAFLAICVPAAFAAPLQLRFADRTVTVEGSTVGGTVALFAVGKEATATTPRMPRKAWEAALLHDDDHDGAVAFTLNRPLPPIATWIAVDVKTGQWAAAGTPGFELYAIPLQELAKHDNAGQLRKLSAEVPEMDVLLVRPGDGAWHLYAARSSAIDESGREDKPLRVDIRHMVPLGDSPAPPNSLKNGDILALIDPVSVRYAVVEVGK